MTYKRKLIEVALPLDAINIASAREIHPSRSPEHAAPLVGTPAAGHGTAP